LPAGDRKVSKGFFNLQPKRIQKNTCSESIGNLCSEIDSDFANLDFGELIEFAVDYRYPDDCYIPELEEIITYK